MARASESVNSIKFVVDKVSFVNKLPLLSRATSDDEHPTPGYMYQQISDLTADRGSYCNDLLDYLVSRLDKRSYHVKLKVLRIMRYVVDKGHEEFRQGLKRRADGVREATKFGGPPDRLHGNAPYILVRKEAKELCSILYEMQPGDTDLIQTSTLGGMGPRVAQGIQGGSHNATMQGFGNTGLQQKSLTESLVGSMRDLANKVLDPAPQAVRPEVLTATHRADRKFSDYRPVQFSDMSAGLSTTTGTARETGHKADQRQQPRIKKSTVRVHVPGVPGGGWAYDDDDVDVANIQQGAALSGSDRENDDVTLSLSRLNMVTPDDYVTERQLVADSVNKNDLLMKRMDVEDFMKKCASVNCAVVVQNIGDVMAKSTHIFQLHGLQLCEALLRTDLVTPDELAAACKCGLNVAYCSQHKQTKVKARKVIRILEKLCHDPGIISGVIPAAENDINNSVTTLSDKSHAGTGQLETGSNSIDQTESISHTTSQSLTIEVLPNLIDHDKFGSDKHSVTAETKEELYSSSFDFIKPPFADDQVIGTSLLSKSFPSYDDGDRQSTMSHTPEALHHSIDSLCTDDNVCE